MYTYEAIVRRVVDGDTVSVDIDLGFKNWIHDEHLRLSGVNTPETRGEEREKGLIAKSLLESLLPVSCSVFITTEKEPGKYGRYIAKISIPDLQIDDLSQYLLDNGYAKEYDGTGSMPRFPLSENYPLDLEDD